MEAAPISAALSSPVSFPFELRFRSIGTCRLASSLLLHYMG